LGEAYAEAFNLSLKAAVPMPENITVLIQAAAARYFTLNDGIISSETIGDLVRKAYFEAAALSTKNAS